MVWHSSLTEENIMGIERVTKAAIRLILGDKYKNYEDGLLRSNLESLEERRETRLRSKVFSLERLWTWT